MQQRQSVPWGGRGEGSRARAWSGDYSGSAWTPFLGPICLGSRRLHQIIKEGKKPEPDGGGHAALRVTRTRSPQTEALF